MVLVRWDPVERHEFVAEPEFSACRPLAVPFQHPVVVRGGYGLAVVEDYLDGLGFPDQPWSVSPAKCVVAFLEVIAVDEEPLVSLVPDKRLYGLESERCRYLGVSCDASLVGEDGHRHLYLRQVSKPLVLLVPHGSVTKGRGVDHVVGLAQIHVIAWTLSSDELAASLQGVSLRYACSREFGSVFRLC